MKWMTFLLCLVTAAYADPIPPGQWQCTAVDGNDRTYSAFGMNIKQAMGAALIHCQQGSRKGQTCRTAQSFCEQGPTSLIDDRCLVSDDSGRSWDATGVDACKTALALCKQFQFLNGISSSQCSVRHR